MESVALTATAEATTATHNHNNSAIIPPMRSLNKESKEKLVVEVEDDPMLEVVKPEQQQHQQQQANTPSREKKTAAAAELKSQIINFMSDKPYLWDRWHPGYNDNKRRENEFDQFANEIDCPVSEIKRVWHVLRTNFFRAHKIQLGKGPHERCWKYYQSMSFILDGAKSNTTASSDEFSRTNNNNNNNYDDSTSSAVQDSSRQTRSSKLMKDARGSRRSVHRLIENGNNTIQHPTTTITTSTPQTSITLSMSTSATDNISTFSSGGPAAATTTATTKSASGRILRGSNRAPGNKNHHNQATSLVAHNNTINSLTDNNQLNQTHTSGPSTSTPAKTAFNEQLSRISFETDEDHLYARSLTSTLKKFDTTTKEVIKLKIQEIIVEYMQKQQQPQPQVKCLHTSKTQD